MDWTQIIITLITLVLVPIISWLLSQLSLLARAKIAAVKSASTLTLLESALAEGEIAVSTAGMETQEIFVKALFDTIDRVKKIMSTAALNIIQDDTGNLDTWIRSRIEAVVGELKSVA